MPTLEVNNFNIVCATLGGFIALFGLVSYLVKEKFYMSETLFSFVAGAIMSPLCANLIRPMQYALEDPETLNYITLYFARLVLGLQLVIAGVQLPNSYLKREWKSLSLLLGPGMIGMWVCSSLLIWAMVPNFEFVYALVVGACITATDPVLANNIVKGKFADKNIPKELQNIIIAESGANDGLGYPFVFLPLYLIKYVVQGGKGSTGDAGTAIKDLFVEIIVYQIILGAAYGAAVGWLAKELLYFAEKRKYVDRESFLVFAVALALFITGTAGMIGSDDVLACFIAGNTFTWDDWFRKETEDDSLQPTVDLLLNVSFFLWIGAVCPWHSFAVNNVIPIYRLIFLGILILMFRRLPVVFAMHKHIRQIEEWRQCFFVGYFGPVGVSGIFYLYVSLQWLKENVVFEGSEREDAARLEEILTVVVWFMVVCSVIGHGLSIPLGKLGLYLPRTLSRAISTDSLHHSRFGLPISTSSRPSFNARCSEDEREANLSFPAPLWRAGRNLISGVKAHTGSATGSNRTTRAQTPRKASPERKSTPATGEELSVYELERRQNVMSNLRVNGDTNSVGSSDRDGVEDGSSSSPEVGVPWTRKIRFPDDPETASSGSGPTANRDTTSHDGTTAQTGAIVGKRKQPEAQQVGGGLTERAVYHSDVERGEDLPGALANTTDR